MLGDDLQGLPDAPHGAALEVGGRDLGLPVLPIEAHVLVVQLGVQGLIPAVGGAVGGPAVALVRLQGQEVAALGADPDVGLEVVVDVGRDIVDVRSVHDLVVVVQGQVGVGPTDAEDRGLHLLPASALEPRRLEGHDGPGLNRGLDPTLDHVVLPERGDDLAPDHPGGELGAGGARGHVGLAGEEPVEVVGAELVGAVDALEVLAAQALLDGRERGHALEVVGPHGEPAAVAGRDAVRVVPPEVGHEMFPDDGVPVVPVGPGRVDERVQLGLGRVVAHGQPGGDDGGVGDLPVADGGGLVVGGVGRPGLGVPVGQEGLDEVRGEARGPRRHGLEHGVVGDVPLGVDPGVNVVPDVDPDEVVLEGGPGALDDLVDVAQDGLFVHALGPVSNQGLGLGRDPEPEVGSVFEGPGQGPRHPGGEVLGHRGLGADPGLLHDLHEVEAAEVGQAQELNLVGLRRVLQVSGGVGVGPATLGQRGFGFGPAALPDGRQVAPRHVGGLGDHGQQPLGHHAAPGQGLEGRAVDDPVADVRGGGLGLLGVLRQDPLGPGIGIRVRPDVAPLDEGLVVEQGLGLIGAPG